MYAVVTRYSWDDAMTRVDLFFNRRDAEKFVTYDATNEHRIDVYENNLNSKLSYERDEDGNLYAAKILVFYDNHIEPDETRWEIVDADTHGSYIVKEI